VGKHLEKNPRLNFRVETIQAPVDGHPGIHLGKQFQVDAPADNNLISGVNHPGNLPGHDIVNRIAF